MSKPIRIFISSTYKDLKDVRDRILKFVKALGTAPISMETFGSDPNTSKEVCLSNVRKSNYFILISGTRYGDIDKETGKGYTELEYDEAVKQDIPVFPYLLSPEAKVNAEEIFAESEEHRSKLKAFKAKLKDKHNPDYYVDYAELALKVTKDVSQKIVAPKLRSPLIRKTTWQSEIPKRVGSRPAPMDFYREEERDHFNGRDSSISDALKLIESNRLCLLIGASGVGKTSLIHAGLFPRLRAIGWRFVYSRPLQRLEHNITSAIHEQLIGDSKFKQLDLVSILGLISNIHKGRQILVVVDQFEEALRDQRELNIDGFLRTMTSIEMGSLPNVHFLIAYRGDAESGLGQLWQQISGDAQGLPRLYLNPLSRSGAIQAMLGILDSEGIEIDKPLLELIAEQISAESMQYLHVAGFYPPYIQIILDSLIKSLRKNETKVTQSIYEELGGARQIIGEYLFQRISELGKRRPQAEQVLLALVRTSGRRITSSVDEVSNACGLPQKDVKAVLKSLAENRLVRAVSEDEYEIVHDYLSELIREKLLRQSGQFEAKQAAELLALRTTELGKILTEDELVTFYQHRERIQPTDKQLKAIVTSGLGDQGPYWYWIHGDKDKWLTIVRQLRSHPTPSIRAQAYLSLGQALGPISITDLEEGLNDDDREVKKQVLDTLVTFCGKDALPLIEKSFADTDREVVKEAFVGAAYLLIEERKKGAHSDDWKTLNIQSDKLSYHVLAEQYGKEMVKPFCEMLKEDDTVIPYLVKIVEGKVPSQLKRLLHSANNEHRANALATLAAIGDKDAFQRLGSELHQFNSELREKTVESAVLACLRHKAPDFFRPQVLERFGGFSNTEITIRALTETFGDRSIPFLMEILRENGETAIEVARLGGEDVVPQLLDLLTEKRRGSIIGSNEENFLTTLLLVALKQDFPWYFDAACFNMGVLKLGLGGISFLDDKLKPPLAKRASEFFDETAIRILKDLVTHEDDNVREFALRILSYLEFKGIDKVLISRLQDEYSGVVEAAAEAIVERGDRKFIEPLYEVLESSEGRLGPSEDKIAGAIAELLVKGGPTEIRKGFRHDSSEVRRAIIETIGKQQSLEFTNELRNMLSDPDNSVRNAASIVVGKTGTEEDLAPLLKMAVSDHNVNAIEVVAILDRTLYCPFEWREVPEHLGESLTFSSFYPMF